MDLDSFRRTLSDDAPPGELTPALRGAWHALRGEWDAAHDAVQPSGADCAWIHAALHRQEGELSNARYWYRRAGRPVADGATADEHSAVAAALLEDAR